MNEESEERGKTSATHKGFWKMRAHGSTSHCQGSCIERQPCKCLSTHTQADFLSFFSSLFFKTCLLNITGFYFFLTIPIAVKVIEEFLFMGCCNFHMVLQGCAKVMCYC